MSDKEIKVSICCITYNHKSYIIDCLEGFLMQKTNFDFEILIHDDASIDGTTEIIKEYENKYPEKIKPVYQTENQYQTNTRAIIHTFLLPHVKGKYIAFCEGDDFWTDPFKLQKQIDVLDKNPNYSACMHNGIVHFMETGKKEKIKQGAKDYIISLKEIVQHKGNFYPTCSLVFRREYYESYPNFCLNCHVGDYPLLIYLATQADIFYLKDVMAVYRKGHSSSWTSYYKACDSEKKAKYLHSEVAMLEKMNCFTDYRYNSLLREKITNMRINYGLRNRKFNELKFSHFKDELKEITVLSRLRLLIKMYLSPIRIISGFKRNG